MSLFGGEMMINLCFVCSVYRFFMEGQPTVLFVFTALLWLLDSFRPLEPKNV